MSKTKFLVLYRSAPRDAGAGEPPARPSPAEMQAMMEAYRAWMERFDEQLVDRGAKLASTGRLLASEGVIDGPYVEAKELIGGYMIVEAEGYDEVVAICEAMPGPKGPGRMMEIRELVTSGM